MGKEGVEKGEGNSNFQRMEFEIQIRERAKIGKMCIGSMEVPAKRQNIRCFPPKVIPLSTFGLWLWPPNKQAVAPIAPIAPIAPCPLPVHSKPMQTMNQLWDEDDDSWASDAEFGVEFDTETFSRLQRNDPLVAGLIIDDLLQCTAK